MALYATRNEGESWRDCVARYAEPHGLKDEALAAFDALMADGINEWSAAWAALYDHDLLGFRDDGSVLLPPESEEN